MVEERLPVVALFVNSDAGDIRCTPFLPPSPVILHYFASCQCQPDGPCLLERSTRVLVRRLQ